MTPGSVVAEAAGPVRNGYVCIGHPSGIISLEVDVENQPDLASHWGVLSVPTTFIIDLEGRPRRVNHGVARETKLRQQIEETSGADWFSDDKIIPAKEPVTAPGLD